MLTPEAETAVTQLQAKDLQRPGEEMNITSPGARRSADSVASVLPLRPGGQLPSHTPSTPHSLTPPLSPPTLSAPPI